jgi:hypothetical protein
MSGKESRVEGQTDTASVTQEGREKFSQKQDSADRRGAARLPRETPGSCRGEGKRAPRTAGEGTPVLSAFFE